MNDTSLNTLRTELLSFETRVWEALASGDSAGDAALLCESFLGVYPDGFAAKPDHVAQLERGASIASFQLGEARARPLGPDHALLSYAATFRRVGTAEDEHMFVSSIWQRRGVGWINIFSQDTPAQTG